MPSNKSMISLVPRPESRTNIGLIGNSPGLIPSRKIRLVDPEPRVQLPTLVVPRIEPSREIGPTSQGSGSNGFRALPDLPYVHNPTGQSLPAPISLAAQPPSSLPQPFISVPPRPLPSFPVLSAPIVQSRELPRPPESQTAGLRNLPSLPSSSAFMTPGLPGPSGPTTSMGGVSALLSDLLETLKRAPKGEDKKTPMPVGVQQWSWPKIDA